MIPTTATLLKDSEISVRADRVQGTLGQVSHPGTERPLPSFIPQTDDFVKVICSTLSHQKEFTEDAVDSQHGFNHD